MPLWGHFAYSAPREEVMGLLPVGLEDLARYF